MHHKKLLCDIGELNHLFRDSVSVQNFLQKIVSLVQKHLQTDVCSIYLYDDAEKVLTLKATVGLKESSINSVKLSLGEGIAGKALEQKELINVSKASEHPDFRSFEGINEEFFDCFLAVPVLRGIERIGVLTLQRKPDCIFDEADQIACTAVASQIGNMIENARFLMAMDSGADSSLNSVEAAPRLEDSGKQHFIKGKSASKGLARSKSKLIDKKRSFKSLKTKDYAKNFTVDDFRQAIQATSQQLETLQKKVEDRLDDAASLIFSSHLLILKDKSFISKVERLISEDGQNAPEAVVEVSKSYIEIFSGSENIFIREKANDVEDIALRIIDNMLSDSEYESNLSGRIVIARDLFPSDLLRLSGENAAGVVLVSGGVTSHLSILANSLGMPVVIANRSELTELPDGTDILLDADAGNLYVNPDKEVLEEFNKSISARKAVEEGRIDLGRGAETLDGKRINLYANINLLSDVKLAAKMNCAGVGLYRTEFPFIVRSSFPTEQEQFVVYKKLVDQMKGRQVTFRTLDVGGDKMLSYYHDAAEKNPAIGLRSIRFSLREKDIFIQQIRAILRAGARADVGIMFPMISSLDEFDMSRSIVNECREKLEAEGLEHNPNPKVGIMVELPSVVEQIDEFAQEADFFSIGTNDFVQFMLGVDRTNEMVENFYIPHHPSVLRALKRIIDACRRADKPVSICGMMAAEPTLTAFLVGIGLTDMSVTPASLPPLKRRIAQLDSEKCRKFAEEILSKSRASEIDKMLEKGI
ncbi:phosphoenolpyruvate--protein phosphotransferase [Sedimentisphaera salicampi]|uniref:phosphoenolpyruvate--protein phosphotransferase n=1 Tax=Sedimentisphaera salicampi TaxID=1941349 RepID=A0A1W6LPS0_9BACT|nr:phosphoenolpyruvate--protein phosphotransferase [Sedimentisphaera salicampi]ARN57751.1 Phosphoenolpyruvate-protein phosphotransferase [Sedimentisphaera salicampi]OXU14309.1 Phosphoenolpyruvate-protein phosphotransferase [Sedimentisphaera salicampi]